MCRSTTPQSRRVVESNRPYRGRIDVLLDFRDERAAAVQVDSDCVIDRREFTGRKAYVDDRAADGCDSPEKSSPITLSCSGVHDGPCGKMACETNSRAALANH